MSAWAKEFLGWIVPTTATADLNPATVPRVEDHAVAYKIPISGTQYYLVSNIQKVMFDEKFPTAGLAILKVNETVVNSGLANNQVNADENNQGVEIMEADGRNDLDNSANRGDAGDLYPGSSNAQAFQNSTTPASIGNVALCDISSPAENATARILISTGRCTTTTSCSSMLTVARSNANPEDWFLILLPAIVVMIWVMLRRRALPPYQRYQQ
jgi:immune inhibitor A